MDVLSEPPPHDEAAERGVLAGILQEFEVVYREVQRVGFEPSRFYIWRHRLVWSAAIGAFDAGRPVTPLEVWQRLGYGGHWVEWGGAEGGKWDCARWLMDDVLSEDPTGYWSMWRAKQVHELAVRRQTIHRARAALRDAYAGIGPAEIAF